MKTNRTSRALLTSGVIAFAAMTNQPLHAAPVGTAFTYQGRLTEQGQPANGIYDFRFVIRDAPAGGNQLRGAETKLGIPVRDGVFSVAIDYGSSVFDGESRWLDIGARTNGGSTFILLTPLQPLRPTPYAVAADVLNGTLPASQLTGSLGSAALGGLYDNPVSFNSPSNHFTGDGSGLKFGGFSYTNLPFYWNVKGNAGTTPGLHFVGTLDAQPLELRVNGQRALRLEPANGSPNLIGGFGGNYTDTGVIGSTIGGGGILEAPNRIIKDPSHQIPQPPEFGVIGGGAGNTISGASYVTIGGGANNLVRQVMWVHPTSPQFHSVIAGGASNELTGSMSTISGGVFNSMKGDLGQDVRGATIGGGVGNSISTITISVEQSTIAGGDRNSIVQADFASIGGGRQNLINNEASHATIGGGGLNRIGTSADNATISGGVSNGIEPNTDGATVGGGASNLVQHFARYAIIGGGFANSIGEDATGAGISGGEFNQVNASYSIISGGTDNLVDSNSVYATIGGGSANEILSRSVLQTRNNTIGGGEANVLDAADYSTIGGGLGNFAGVRVRSAVIGGGENNSIDALGAYSVIAGGASNFMGHYNIGATISGGSDNLVGADAQYSTVGGGFGNVGGGHYSVGATVGGGVENLLSGATYAGTISGGASNVIQGNTQMSTIGGGAGNFIDLLANNATIGGGNANTIGQNAVATVISGGESNIASAPYSTVAGGQLNIANGTNSYASGYSVQASGEFSAAFGNTTIASGKSSTAMGTFTIASGIASTALGGGTDATGNASTAMGAGATASGPASTAMGSSSVASGYISTAMGSGTSASGDNSTAMGARTVASGGSSTAMGAFSIASGSGSTAMGIRTIASGLVSTAMGYLAQATNDGTFVWADGQEADFTSTGTNQFLVRASGGVGINTDSPQFTLHVNGEAGKPGGGAWSVASDARLKKDIRSLDEALERLLQLHGVTYEYKDPKAIHELPGQQTGMIAQEVEKVFPEWVETAPDGMRRLSIRGFEALTVEALRDLRTEKDRELKELRNERDEQIRVRDERIGQMEHRLAALERAMESPRHLAAERR